MATKYGYGTIEENQGKAVKFTDKNAEIARTTQVIQNRMKDGLDTTHQLSHYKNLTGQDYQAPEPSYLEKFTQQINAMFDQQKQARLAELQAQRDRATGMINQQKAEVKPAYQGLRNQTDTVNLQGVQKLREAMADAGLTSSGENVSGQVSLANQRQNSLNSLNLQEQQQLNDLDRRIADINNPAEAQALINQLEAQRAEALLNLGMQAEQMDYTRGRDQVMDNRWQTQFDLGRNQWQQQYDYQLGRDRVEDARWREQWEYGKQRDTISDQQRNAALQWEKQQFQTEQAWRQYVYNNMSASEKAQLEWNREMFGDEMAWRMEESNRADRLARDRMEFEAGFQQP
ncbi:hypothetical protein SAMN05877753_111148 [Bacillus oleivorans]|uniref:Uncharacterized protein n=1 Tax=Bacillus oleivorans TaxID=1448271 RepID=A0A285D678_9BACI|nr:hypothetical protein [Bacillus oleivorans]SNX75312.1 hypothetical protein SAMN05877753_111148 [Bacillus oleivorans]